MRSAAPKSDIRAPRVLTVFIIVFAFVFSSLPVAAQSSVSESAGPAASSADNTKFRIEKVPVKGGSELFTIFARSDDADNVIGPTADQPLVSILRDTLGDDVPENDRLRYVWMLNYTRPSLAQKITAAIPFLYTRTTNKGEVGSGPPPHILDVQPSDKPLWDSIFWTVMKNVIGQAGIGVKASASHYRQNAEDRKRTAIAGAIAVLTLYQEVNGEKLLSDVELRDVYARLSLDDKTLGWHMQSENLGRVYEKDLSARRDMRGNNWELLRQYTEAQGLYFDPLEMPDGSDTHAIVWTTAEDIAANKGKAFNSRFLNIKNPWTDKRLAKWRGYTQTRWFDSEDREVAPDTPTARSRTMVPLAVYGLDHPKIPILLVDLRDSGNAKKREISKRVLLDLTGNVISLAGGGLPYFFGRFIYDFVTGRRGMDINQVSRMRSYAQLKLLLSLDETLDGEFKNTLEHRVESASLNPLENDSDVEARVARKQYENLIAYAKAPDGLSARVDRDRREEMVRLKHGSKERVLFSLAHVFSFGLYTHREDATPALVARMDTRRQLDFHERKLSEIAFASAGPEVDSDTEQLEKSLAFVSEHGAAARSKTSRSLGKIFAMSTRDDIKMLCVTSLYRINNSSAKKELLSIYNRRDIPKRWNDLSASYLKLALEEGQRMAPRDAKMIAGISH